MNKLISAVSALALLWGTIPAEANFTITTGSGTTVVAIDATNSGGTTACTTASTECPATVLIDSGGALLSTTTHVLNVNANAGTNLNTSALATDTHLTALGTSLLGTDAHLTAFTSANHTDLAAINTTLGTPLQASGTVVATQATAANLKSQVNVVSGGIASGGVASGAFASGALAAGSGTDGWNVTEGTKADTAWVSGSGSIVSILKTIASAGASSAITGWGGGTLGAMANYGTSPGAVLVPGINAFVTNTNANGQATAANSSPVVLPAAQVTADPCALGAKTPFAFSSSSGEFQLVAPSGSTQVYICSIVVTSTAADSISLVGGTGATCTTGTPAAIVGSTTAANGLPIAATAGWVQGNGFGTAYRTITAGHGVCILQSGTTLIAGGGTYVQL